VREVFGVRAAMLRLLQPDGALRAIASSGEGFLEQSGGEILPAGVGLVGRAVAEGRLMQSADLLKDSQTRLTDDMRDYHLRSGHSSVLAAPLRAHEKIIGALGILERRGRVYSDDEVALLQTFANQAAVALENARLYGEAQTREKELKEINRMLSALHAVAAAASQSLDLEQVLRAAIEKITDIFAFDATQIHLYDDLAGEARLITYLEKDGQFSPAVGRFKRGEGIIGRVLETGKPLIFADAPNDPEYLKLSRSKMFTRLPYHFFAVFPIKSKRRTLGTLACNGKQSHKMKAKDIQLIEAMADQIAVAIENSDLYAQIRQKFEELEQKTNALEQANKIKEEFLSVMSHELRTPLNAILGYTDMVRDGMLGPVNSEQERCLAKVVGRARELLTMINGILQVTSMEAPRSRNDSYPVNLNEFFDELRSGYGFSSNKDVTLHWQAGELPMFETDPERLRHILQNLINNAIKFTAKGRVTVSTRHLAERERIEFKVSDTGIGIPREKMPIIFEKFRQVDSSETRSYGGVGLGLYIVKQYVDGLGGTIDVESTVGQGSCFTVTLPCAAPARSAAGKNAAA
jgi:signal transduction histidine kinase